MLKRSTKLRWRRQLRKHRKQVEDIGINAEQGLEAHFFKRLYRLLGVWRFTAAWIGLLVALSVGTVLQIRALGDNYQALVPAPGGTYTEGIIGTFTTANPMYATGAADSSVSRLVFSGLAKFNQENELELDIAKSIDTDSTNKIYTVGIREDVYWHDGRQLTADDVVFTFTSIKNPDARSPYFNTWKDVKITKKDNFTVVFELPNVLSTFKTSLTVGLVPKHKLSNVEPVQLRTAKFNTVNPVGTGPFKLDELQVAGNTKENRQEVIGMVPNERFYGSVPKLSKFVIRTYRDESQMIEAYEQGSLTSMVGLASVPDNVREVPDFNEYSVPMAGSVMVFFKTTTPPLDDTKVRRALVQAIDQGHVLRALTYPVKPVKSPILNGHIGYNEKYEQLPNDLKQAAKYLDEAGWKMGEDGIRKKKDKELTFTLYAQNTSDYSAVSSRLQNAWKEIGVKVEVVLQSDNDMQGVVSRHEYDALLYGISIGNDPDVFAYWHSSQAGASSPSRLNFSEYKSKSADEALEAGRTRVDPKVRGAKYEPFLKAWREDAPALALYQPKFIYVTRGQVFNFEPKSLNDITNRYANVENWMIRQERTIKD